ncbi:hypothetical protein AHF37_11577 [Paragonimus kellicotti]|nr:hypothetical protein AHF37_11577 [Paragonimus kellicotti]
MKNFSSLLALLLAVQEVPECILNKKSRSLLEMFSGYMKPPIFTGYRRDLEAAELPYLPYLGLIFQQLIHLHAGNSVYLSETADRPMITNGVQNTQESPTGPPLGVMQQSQTSNGQIINVWRCWKHYLILGYFIKRNENLATRYVLSSPHNFSPVVLSYVHSSSTRLLSGKQREC